MKQCSRCKIQKSLTEFYIDKRTNSPRSHCKSCQKLYNQQWRKTNPEKTKIQNNRNQLSFKLKHIYKITREELNEISLNSAMCPLCLNELSNCIDHSHTTNQVRGLIGNKCNLVLGLVNDDIKVLERMIQYLSSRSSVG